MISEIQKQGMNSKSLENLINKTYDNQSEFRKALSNQGIEDQQDVFKIFSSAKIERYIIDSNFAKEKLNPGLFTTDQINAVKLLHGKTFSHKWQIVNRLNESCDCWIKLENISYNEPYNKELDDKYSIIFSVFKIQ